MSSAAGRGKGKGGGLGPPRGYAPRYGTRHRSAIWTKADGTKKGAGKNLMAPPGDNSVYDFEPSWGSPLSGYSDPYWDMMSMNMYSPPMAPGLGPPGHYPMWPDMVDGMALAAIHSAWEGVEDKAMMDSDAWLAGRRDEQRARRRAQRLVEAELRQRTKEAENEGDANFQRDEGLTKQLFHEALSYTKNNTPLPGRLMTKQEKNREEEEEVQVQFLDARACGLSQTIIDRLKKVPQLGGSAVRLGTADKVSAESFWRLLELCCKAKPRPPLRVIVTGEIGHLGEVLTEADRRGLRSAQVTRWPGSNAGANVEGMDLDVVVITTPAKK